mmetsp:Transcript_24531/g.74806  ORF Transcript_24531/g.74806 Transcript_24531/m.74806 type:complete len:476 (+) Transcript_24531:1914-3341(+)
MGVLPTDDSAKYEWDSAKGTGAPISAKLMAALDPEKKFLSQIVEESGLVGLVLDRTSFYAEAGGQVCDIGSITTSSGATFEVTDVQKFGAFIAHIGRITDGELSVGDDVSLTVDYGRRAPIACNHTSTHMLNHALREALATDADQRGSLCDADKLRFDFAYSKPLTVEELSATQAAVNRQIKADLAVHSQVVPLESAKAINGLRAVFGEQYPDPVRVVTVGGPGVSEMISAPDTADWRDYSVEFCGGTHIARSSEPRTFVLLSEEGIGGGVRRVVGVTGDRAEAAQAEARSLGKRFKAAEALADEDIEPEAAELSRLLDAATIPLVEKKEFTAALAALKKRALEASKAQAAGLAAAAKEEADALAANFTAGAPFFVALLKTEADIKVVEAAVTAIAAVVKDVPIMVLGAGKTASALALCPKGSSIDAKDWINAALEPCGGKGGGKPIRAQGNARDPTNVAKALEAAKAFAESKSS